MDAIKIFERDEKVLEQLKLSESTLSHIEQDIKAAEDELDDDAESIITNERYIYIAQLMKVCYKKKSAGKLSTSDKIDKVVTNRFAALPIFAVVAAIIISMVLNRKKGKSSCGCGCLNCPMSGSCHSKK